MEMWKKIRCLNGEYEVSNIGNIRSTFNIVIRSNGWRHTRVSKVLKPATTKDGYRRVGVCVNKKLKTFNVHRLVALEFIENPLNKAEVNHINGIKDDNRVDNLEWVTRQENLKHCIDNKLQTAFKGEEIGNSKLKEYQVLEIRNKFIPRIYSRVKLAKEYNVSEATIKDILQKRTWKHLL